MTQDFEILHGADKLSPKVFIYSIVILFNLFLRNLLIATIVTEFRERSLPKKYSGKKKLIRARIRRRAKRGGPEAGDQAVDTGAASPHDLRAGSLGDLDASRPVSPFRPASPLASGLLSPARPRASESGTNPRASLAIADAPDREDPAEKQPGEASQEKKAVGGLKGRLLEARRNLERGWGFTVRQVRAALEQAWSIGAQFKSYVQRIYYR